MDIVADLAVIGAASVLLLSGSSKIARPRPITTTLVMLWNTATRQARSTASPRLGLMLGVGEMGLAAVVATVRSWPAGLVLVLFAAGLAAAGVMGVLSGGEVPYACFGKGDRTLGYGHILQLPLWIFAAWAVAQGGTLFSAGTRLEQTLAMLAVCTALSTALQVARAWRAVYPIARQRRKGAAEAAVLPPAGAGVSSW